MQRGCFFSIFPKLKNSTATSPSRNFYRPDCLVCGVPWVTGHQSNTDVAAQLFCIDSVRITGAQKSQSQSATTFLFKCAIEVIIMSRRLWRREKRLTYRESGMMEKDRKCLRAKARIWIRKRLASLMQARVWLGQALFSPIKNQMTVISNDTHAHLNYSY